MATSHETNFRGHYFGCGAVSPPTDDLAYRGVFFGLSLKALALGE
jgi:hypothetical protein